MGETHYHSCFGDIVFAACDSYLDVAACKQYSSALFDQTDYSTEIPQRMDTREDCVVSRGKSFERNEFIRAPSSGDSQSRCGAAPRQAHGDHCNRIFPITFDDEEDEPVRQNPDYDRKDIFRSTNVSNTVFNQSEYSEFHKLCRCTAWSVDDSSGSGMMMDFSTVPSSEGPTHLVQWKDVLNDTGDLSRRFTI